MNAFIGGYQTGGQTTTRQPEGNEVWRSLSDAESGRVLTLREDTQVATPSRRVVRPLDLFDAKRECPKGHFKWLFDGNWYGTYRTMAEAKARFGGAPLKVLSKGRRCNFTARTLSFEFGSYESAFEWFGGDPLQRLFFSEELVFQFEGLEPDRFRSYAEAVERYGGCPWEQMKICSHPTEVANPDFVGPRWEYNMVYVPKVSAGMTRILHRNGFH